MWFLFRLGLVLALLLQGILVATATSSTSPPSPTTPASSSSSSSLHSTSPTTLTTPPSSSHTTNAPTPANTLPPTSSENPTTPPDLTTHAPTAPPTSPSTTTPPPPKNCENGGFLLDNRCICPSYFQGESCETLICINGGYKNDKRCVCPPGFWGQHCDAVTELQSPSNAFAKPEDTFNLYVYNKISIYNGAISLSEFIKAVEGDIHVKNYQSYNYWHYVDAKHGTTASPLGTDKIVHTQKWDEFKKDIEATTFSDPDYECTPVNLYQNLLELLTTSQLTSTTLTVFTQFPGHSDWEVYDKLKATALAFGVRINFIVPDDPLLLGCNFTSDHFVNMKDLAVNTGGTFVVVNDLTAKNGIAPVIQMHYRTQLVAFFSADDCSNADFPFTVDFVEKNYTAFVTTSDPLGALECDDSCTKVNDGTQNTQIYKFQSAVNLPQNWKLNFTGACTVQVLNDGDTGLRIFQSYVPSTALDTSYIQPVQGVPLFLRLHGELYEESTKHVPVNKIAINSKQSEVANASTFPFVLSEAITCHNESYYRWELLVTVNGQRFFRYLPYNCFQTTPDFLPTTPATATDGPKTLLDEVEEYSEFDEDIFDFEDSNKTVICENATLPTLFLAISCSIGGTSVDNIATGGSYFAEDGLYASYKVVIFDIDDKKDSEKVLQAGDLADFQVIMTNSLPKLCTGAPIKNQTDIVDIIQKYVLEADLKNSPIFLAVPSVDVGNVDESIIRNVTAKGNMVFALIQEDHSDSDDSSLLTLTTVTGGQIFSIYSEQDGEDVKAQQITTHLLESVLPNKPIFAATTNPPPGTNTQIGYINVDQRGTVTFDVTITGLNVLDTLTIHISDQVIFYQQADLATNYLNHTITVSKSGPITVMKFLEDYKIYIRIWERVEPGVKLDLGDADDANGASLAVLLPEEEVFTATVQFYDCNGNEATLPNANQEAGVGNWSITGNSCGTNFDFVPFFCTSNQSSCLVAGTEDLYSYQLTAQTNNGIFQYWGSFLCPHEPVSCEHGTKNSDVCYCEPEFDGPQCQVPNCNDNGHLYFNQTAGVAECVCDDGYSGPNCDIATSGSNETVSAALFDSAYRTLTVIMLYNSADDLKQLKEDTLKTLPDNMTPTAFGNVWSYHAFVQNGDQRDVLAIGTSLNKADISVSSLTGNSTEPIALEEAVAYALKATGHLQRGIVWITVSPKVNLTINSDLFYRTTAGYRQEVFVSVSGSSTPDEYNSVAQAVLVTGGQLMVFESSDTIDNTVLTNILGTSASLTFFPESDTLNAANDIKVAKDDFVIISANDAGDISTLCADLPVKDKHTCLGVATADITISAKSAVFVSARDLKHVSMSWTFVSEAQKSDWSAIPNTETKVVNVIVHTEGEKVNLSNRKGFIKRDGAIKADFVVDTATVGYKRLEVQLDNKGSRYVPFAVVSGSPSCQNNGVLSNGYCSCTGDQFTGADCSIPQCQNGGVLNTEGSACHCNESMFYGLSCEHSRN